MFFVHLYHMTVLVLTHISCTSPRREVRRRRQLVRTKSTTENLLCSWLPVWMNIIKVQPWFTIKIQVHVLHCHKIILQDWLVQNMPPHICNKSCCVANKPPSPLPSSAVARVLIKPVNAYSEHIISVYNLKFFCHTCMLPSTLVQGT